MRLLLVKSVNHLQEYFNIGIICCCLLFSSQIQADDTIKIGVRAYNGVEHALNKWNATANFLTKAIENSNFELVPVTGIEELTVRTGNKEFDFILTTPSSYIDIQHKFQASRILTLKNQRQGKPYTQFGSVIFTLKSRTDINQIEDLKDKDLMVISERAFGGWRVAWGEMLDNDFDPYEKLNSLKFSGQNTQESVVYAVVQGFVDAGVVRTDMLELMNSKNLIDIDKFKIIGGKKTEGFPFLHSTQLYPEWAFVKSRHTSDDLAQEVAIALLKIKKSHAAAQSGKYAGWNVPLDYSSVDILLKKLRVEPYENYGKLSSEQVIIVYRKEILIALSLFILIFSVSLYLYRMNSKLNEKRKSIEADKSLLKKEIGIRNHNIALLDAISKSQSNYIYSGNEEYALKLLLSGILDIVAAEFGVIIKVNLKENVTSGYRIGSIIFKEPDEILSIDFDVNKCKTLLDVFSQVENFNTVMYNHIALTELGFKSNSVKTLDEDINNLIALPLVFNEKLLGILCIVNKSISFNDDLPALLSPVLLSCINLISHEKKKQLADDSFRALKNSEYRQREIISTMSDALITINHKSIVELFNPEAEKLFGYTAKEIVGFSITQLLPKSVKRKHDGYLSDRFNSDKLSSSIFINEISCTRKDGTIFPANLSVTEMTINGKKLLNGFIRDITESKKHETILREKEAAELANKAKSDFLANMSHEFRTPMHAIMSFSSLGLKKIKNDIYDESLSEYLTHIQNSGNRLMTLIDDILDLAAIEAGKIYLNYNSCQLDDLLEQCLAEVEPLYMRQNLNIEIIKDETNFLVKCDNSRIKQVMVNLLSNAIKFSPLGETVSIEITRISFESKNGSTEAYKLSVMDRGIGVPEDELTTIFDKFVQSSKTNTQAGGTGLGLSICKELIDLHSGEVQAINRKGGGTSFSFILPLEPWCEAAA